MQQEERVPVLLLQWEKHVLTAIAEERANVVLTMLK